MSQKTNFELVSELNTNFGNAWGDGSGMGTQLDLIREEYEETKEAFHQGSKIALCDGLGDLLVVTYGAFHKAGVDANVIMLIIDHCNNSKFCQSEEDVEKTLDLYQKKGLNLLSVGTSPNGFQYVYMNATDYDEDGKKYPQGKFLKNHGWLEPEPMIKAYLDGLAAGKNLDMAEILSAR